MLTWLVPVVAGAIVLGPALAPGSLFNLDLVLVPHFDLPNGFWGLGPELPRRLPLWVPISWLSPWIPATISGKALMLAVFVLAWVGMTRLAHAFGVRWAFVAGALYALSPFVLTRTAVGHFMITVPLAVLPWVLPVLLRPGRSLSRTFLGAAALSLGGHFGGSLAVTVVVVALLCGERKRWGWALLVTVVAQGAWLVPALAVASAGDANLAPGAVFGTDASGVLGLLRLSAGGGFWNTYFQVGVGSAPQALAGLVLLALAVFGTRSIVGWARRPMVALAAIGWLVSAASTMVGVSAVLDWFTGTTIGAVWREPQRVLVLYLVWLAPAAVLGAQRAYDTALASPKWLWSAGAFAALPAVVAAVLVAPGVWGVGGQLHAESVPSSWNATRALVRDQPGTVLALPWFQYYNQQLDGGPVRRVLNPMPLFLGGDVLAASNNGLQAGVQERADPREPAADVVVRAMTDGSEPPGRALAALGVRWVVLQKTVHLKDYAALSVDPDLEVKIDDDAMALYEVKGWTGGAFDATSGESVATSGTGPAWVHLADTEGNDVIWNHPASGGWRRGWSDAATATEDGRLRFDSGGGVVWNVATLPSLLSQFVVLGLTVVAGWRVRRSRTRWYRTRSRA